MTEGIPGVLLGVDGAVSTRDMSQGGGTAGDCGLPLALPPRPDTPTLFPPGILNCWGWT